MKTIKILVVEDEAITREVLVEQLADLGYEVAGATAFGAEAVQLVADTQPNLVLMDIKLRSSDVDGITAANRIREEFAVPVVYLTAHSDADTLKRAKLTEPFGYIVKPFNERSLQAAIEVALYKHQMEQRRIQDKQFLEMLLQSMGDGVVATNHAGAITYMNPSAERITGWPQPEATGQGIEQVVQLVDEASGQAIPHPVREVLETGQVVYLNDYVALITRNGDRKSIADSVSPLHHEAAPIGAVMVVTDVSDRRRVAKLQQMAQQSQESETAMRQLLAAEQELSRLKDQVIATVSHEYKTPLAVILSSSELLREYRHRFSPEQIANHFDAIRNSVRLLSDLVEELALFKQTQDKAFSFDPQPVSLAEFCQELLVYYQLASSDRHSFQLSLQFTQPAPVLLDKKILRYVLGNLLSNAIKYSPAGGQITLSCAIASQQIILQVTDQGIGIEASDLAQVFAPFFRATNAAEIKGTGMGLSIAQNCVELHGGKITVESQVGQGSTFSVTLPLGWATSDVSEAATDEAATDRD